MGITCTGVLKYLPNIMDVIYLSAYNGYFGMLFGVLVNLNLDMFRWLRLIVRICCLGYSELNYNVHWASPTEDC